MAKKNGTDEKMKDWFFVNQEQISIATVKRVADEMANTIKTMEKMSSLTQQMSEITHSMVTKMEGMVVDIEVADGRVVEEPAPELLLPWDSVRGTGRGIHVGDLEIDDPAAAVAHRLVEADLRLAVDLRVERVDLGDEPRQAEHAHGKGYSSVSAMAGATDMAIINGLVTAFGRQGKGIP